MEGQMQSGGMWQPLRGTGKHSVFRTQNHPRFQSSMPNLATDPLLTDKEGLPYTDK